MDNIEWLEKDMNECGMMGMMLEWDGCYRMTVKWYEWMWNDGNEDRMSWMPWNDWKIIWMVWNDGNEARMSWML